MNPGNFLKKTNLRFFLFIPLFAFGVPYYLYAKTVPRPMSASAVYSRNVITAAPRPSLTPIAPSATSVPTPSPLPPTPIPSPAPTAPPSGDHGAARKVEGSQYGYTMEVKDDSSMATPGEVFDALNRYRVANGVAGLAWDQTLADYAQSRADLFQSQGLDEHKGFLDYASNSDNRKHLGYWILGENASKGYTLSGSHLIEWVFAGDAPHNDNQLRASWGSVGIGVRGDSVDLIFGGSKM